MLRVVAFVAAFLAPPQGQPPPVMRYTLRVDSADLAGFDVELRIQSAPDTFRLAMAAHPEYDDRYWRFVEGGGPRVEARSGPATIAREDSALWRGGAPGGGGGGRYPPPPPPPPAPALPPAWEPLLAP